MSSDTDHTASTQPVKQRCPECESERFIRDYDKAEIVCMDCGLVVATKLADKGPEWRAFDSEQRAKRARTGGPSTFAVHDKGLSTMIDRRDRDVSGRRISSDQKAQMWRLRKWQQRIRVSDATERNLASALGEITRIAYNLNLPENIVETASIIYRKAVKQHLVRGRTIHTVISASLYVACRKGGIIRTLEEIAQASTISKKELGNSYRFLVKKLNYDVPPPKSSQYINRIASHLALNGNAEAIAQRTIIVACEMRLTSGRGPKGIAAAANYIASVLTCERKTQREIAEVAQVTEVTIRNRYKELVEKIMFEMTL
jgi:transcription initiation factor TFIIB